MGSDSVNALTQFGREIGLAFGAPAYFYLGIGVLLVVVAGLWRHAVRRRRLARFLGGRRAAERLASTDLYRFRWERLALLGGAAIALGAAAADPLWRSEASVPPPPPAERHVMMALDVSASMQASDEEPTRLAAAVQVARRIIADAGDQKIGLLLFAGEAYLLSPPTNDFAVLEYLLSGVTPTIASAQDPGTLLSAAIIGAAGAFVDPAAAGSVTAIAGQAPPIRSIVVVSDGDANETEAAIVAALESAAMRDAAVHAVGLGGTTGSPMVMPRGQYQLGGPVLAADGSRAVSRARPALLARVADLGSGVFIDSPDAGLDPLMDRLRPSVESFAPTTVSGLQARFDPTAWLVAIALVALVLEGLLDVRIPRFARMPRGRFA